MVLVEGFASTGGFAVLVAVAVAVGFAVVPTDALSAAAATVVAATVAFGSAFGSFSPLSAPSFCLASLRSFAALLASLVHVLASCRVPMIEGYFYNRHKTKDCIEAYL